MSESLDILDTRLAASMKDLHGKLTPLLDPAHHKGDITECATCSSLLKGLMTMHAANKVLNKELP